MTSIRLYKLLQNHIGNTNSLIVKLREDLMTKDEVKKIIIEDTKKLLKELKV